MDSAQARINSNTDMDEWRVKSVANLQCREFYTNADQSQGFALFVLEQSSGCRSESETLNKGKFARLSLFTSTVALELQ